MRRLLLANTDYIRLQARKILKYDPPKVGLRTYRILGGPGSYDQPRVILHKVYLPKWR